MKNTSKNHVSSSKKMIHIRLPEDSHKKLKKLVIDKDTTVQDWVLNLVEVNLKQESK